MEPVQVSARLGPQPEAENASANTSAPPSSDQWRAAWPDISRLFPRDSWRAVEEFFHDPFAGRGALERWFGDFSSSRFQPRIDVVDEGNILRVTVELPGMERDDLTVSAEDGALVLRGEKKQDVHARKTAAIGSNVHTEGSCAPSPCRRTPILSARWPSSTKAC